MLILMVFVASTISAQSYFNVYATQSAHWNGYNWAYEEVKDNTMTITMKGYIIFVSDQAESYYHCSGNNGDGSFYATDEKGRKCMIYISKAFNEYPYVSVIYNDFLIRYYYN